MVPGFRNDADKSGNYGWAEKVLHLSFGITISFENLVHHGGFLPVRLPFRALLAILDAVALHIHFGGQRLTALRYNGGYLLDFEQIDL